MNLEELLKMAKRVGIEDSVMGDLSKKDTTFEGRILETEELKRRVSKVEGPYAIPPMHPVWDYTPPPPFIPVHDDKIDAGKYWGGITTDAAGTASTVTGTMPTITVDELIELAKNKDAIDAHLKEKVQPTKKEEVKPMTQNELTGSW